LGILNIQIWRIQGPIWRIPVSSVVLYLFEYQLFIILLLVFIPVLRPIWRIPLLPAAVFPTPYLENDYCNMEKTYS
jgi:hypothetical protein